MDKAMENFTIHIDRNLGAGFISHWGSVCLMNLNDAVFRFNMLPGIECVTRGISDFRQCQGTLSYEEVRSHAKYVSRSLPRGRRMKWAVLVRSNLGYGLARMFDMFMENENINLEVNVFKDLRKANSWLGIEEKHAGCLGNL